VLVNSQGLMRLGARAFTGYRVFKERRPSRIIDDARRRFQTECEDLGGHFNAKTDPRDIALHYALPKRLGFFAEDMSMCVDARGDPLSALIAYGRREGYPDSHVALFVMTKTAATDMIASYRREQAAAERRYAEWRHQWGVTSRFVRQTTICQT
jgi:hypothetical protein